MKTSIIVHNIGGENSSCVIESDNLITATSFSEAGGQVSVFFDDERSLYFFVEQINKAHKDYLVKESKRGGGKS